MLLWRLRWSVLMPAIALAATEQPSSASPVSETGAYVCGGCGVVSPTISPSRTPTRTISATGLLPQQRRWLRTIMAPSWLHYGCGGGGDPVFIAHRPPCSRQASALSLSGRTLAGTRSWVREVGVAHLQCVNDRNGGRPHTAGRVVRACHRAGRILAQGRKDPPQRCVQGWLDVNYWWQRGRARWRRGHPVWRRLGLWV
jgi:hypothetical protein